MGTEKIQFVPQNHREINEYHSGYDALVRTNDAGVQTLDLLIEGVYCAACIQKIEGLFASDPEIQKARLNFTSRKLSVAWKGDPERANTYVQQIESLGYTPHPYNETLEKSQTLREEKSILLCLGVAGFAMGNIMLLSVGLWSTDTETMGVGTRDFLHWISAFIALPTIAFSARPFYRSAYAALSHGRTNMDVPISIGITLATLLSLYETANHGEHVFFDSAVMLIFFLLIGRYLDFRARRQARSAASDLLSIVTGFADVMDENGALKRYPVSALKAGMIVLVPSGGTVPVDGAVQKGEGQVDTSLITGETLPQDVQEGSKVYAGCLNLGAPILVLAHSSAGDTVLDDVLKLMEDAKQSQARYVRLADKAARLYTPVVHFFAAITFLGWVFIMGAAWQQSLMIAISVLIITCPCALALAVPVVQVLATGILMRMGILIKSGDALERLAQIDTIFMDKTGTLTLGKPTLVDCTNKENLGMAVALARYSHHPLSGSLQAYGTNENTFHFTAIEEVVGQGVQAILNNKTVRLGRPSWCEGQEVFVASPHTTLALKVGEETSTFFMFEDGLRDDVPAVIQRLKSEGYDMALLSGDRTITVEAVAAKAGLAKYTGDMTPTEKYNMMKDATSRGHKVLMIGDGLNDAPTLAGAYVSMAPGTALDLTKNAADLVYMGARFSPVFSAIQIAKLTQKLVRENFMITVLYNMIAIPIAVAGYVTPFVAALAMSGSSLLVIANSFRLKGYKT